MEVQVEHKNLKTSDMKKYYKDYYQNNKNKYEHWRRNSTTLVTCPVCQKEVQRIGLPKHNKTAIHLSKAKVIHVELD